MINNSKFKKIRLEICPPMPLVMLLNSSKSNKKQHKLRIKNKTKNINIKAVQ